jgi:hypothetical protein
VRAILFIFPNTFEYFFDFVEAVHLRWNWKPMGKWTVGMLAVNFGIVALLLVFVRVVGVTDTRAHVGKTLFFTFLFTVITVLYDRYHAVFRARGVLRRGSAGPAQSAPRGTALLGSTD